jgi:ATP-dependent DNA helicase DinG
MIQDFPLKRQLVETHGYNPYLVVMSTETLRSVVDRIFSPSGTLAERAGYEHRPQQAAMATAVAEALQGRRHLLVEAPTGVGKTLAYLIPALAYAAAEKRKAVLSTHTKNLQDQLQHKDIPLAQSLLGTRCAVATLKGRRNYLCTTRLEHAVGTAGSMFDAAGSAELGRIRDWSRLTKDGDVEGLGFAPRPDVWEMICSEQGVCGSGLCSAHCFFQRAKVRAREAQAVVMNHALFFSLFAVSAGDDRCIFPDDFVILDEAHTIEAVAGAGVGMRISRRAALIAIRRLYNPSSKKGVIAGRRRRPAAAAARAEESVNDFFATAGRVARAMASAPAGPYAARPDVRLRNPAFIVNTLDESLRALDECAGGVEEATGDLFASQEISAARRSLQEVRAGVERFLEQSDRALTYWVEAPPGENVALCAAPSDVGSVLGRRLFRPESSVIMTSATLSVNGDLGYFSRRVGAPAAETLVLDSPFNHARQMTVCLARDIPEPDTEGYQRDLPEWIMRSVDRTKGKALVLFTNESLMRTMAAALVEEFAQRGIRVLVQGIDGQRHDLLEQFKSDIQSVLFGLESFWMGIDVPGEALQHVIMTRLPFSVPNHPLIEARLEAITARGGNSFLEYTLPEAVLKFKQGAGRLLRTREDTGVVTILDARILRRSYGKTFISSIPPCPLEICSSDGEVERMDPFLS